MGGGSTGQILKKGSDHDHGSIFNSAKDEELSEQSVQNRLKKPNKSSIYDDEDENDDDEEEDNEDEDDDDDDDEDDDGDEDEEEDGDDDEEDAESLDKITQGDMKNGKVFQTKQKLAQIKEEQKQNANNDSASDSDSESRSGVVLQLENNNNSGLDDVEDEDHLENPGKTSLVKVENTASKHDQDSLLDENDVSLHLNVRDQNLDDDEDDD